MVKRTMLLIGLGALSLLAACGTETDARPVTLAYITPTILRPSCAGGACHSTLSKTAGYAFDTVKHVREGMQDGELVNLSVPDDSLLMRVLVGDGVPRMPPDGPLPDKDLDLVETWIREGAQ